MRKLIKKVKDLIETNTDLTASEFMTQVGYAFFATLSFGLVVLYLIR